MRFEGLSWSCSYKAIFLCLSCAVPASVDLAVRVGSSLLTSSSYALLVESLDVEPMLNDI